MGKEKQAAQEILEHIDGQENILSVEHCATRLRPVPKDASELDEKKIEAIDGAKGSPSTSDQHQIIPGAGFVNKVYQQVPGITGMDIGKVMPKIETATANMNAVRKTSRLLGDVFLLTIPTLVATELLMGSRSLITDLGVELSPTFLTLSQTLIDTAFSFLPALIIYSVMKRLGASPTLGTVIGLILVAFRLPNVNQVASGSVELICLNPMGPNIPTMGYQGSMLPTLILDAIAAKIERGLGKIVPDVLNLVAIPFITLLSNLFIELIIVGPIMHMVEQGLMVLISILMNIPFGIGDFIIDALRQAVIMTGLHHASKAFKIELLADTGANPFDALVCDVIVAQGAADIMAVPRTEDKKRKSLYSTSVVSTFLDITRPLVFGENLSRLTPFICGCIRDRYAGIFSSIVDPAGAGMSITALPGMLLYLNGQPGTYLIAHLIGFMTTFALNYVVYKPVEEWY